MNTTHPLSTAYQLLFLRPATGSKRKTLEFNREDGGWEGNRTPVYGFANRCITTLPPSPNSGELKVRKSKRFEYAPQADYERFV